MPLAVRAAGAVLQYLQETQPASLGLFTGLNTYSLSEFMTLDAATRRNLELTETIRTGVAEGSLLGVLDYAVTPMGKRLIRQWVGKPLLEIEKIKQRQDGIDFFFQGGLQRAEIRAALKPLNDLERLTNRILGGSAQPRDLIATRNTLEYLPGIKNLVSEDDNALKDALSNFHQC